MTRSILIALLRSDLRLHDHAIFSACRPGSSALPNVTHVVPVYVFDQKYVEVGGITGLTKGKGPGHNGAKTRVAGFWRCGPHRTRFVTRSVYDLKARLKKLGSDLSIWAGQPDVVLAKLVEAFQRGGDKVEAVWMSGEEVNTEKRIKKALAPSQTPLKLVENSSLIDPKDLPFDIKDLPDVFTHFRKRVEAPDMFKPPESAPDKLLPFVEVPKVDNGPGVFKVGDDVSEESLIAQLLAPLDKEPGPLPVLGQLKGQDLPNALPFKGGETEALARLDHYFGGGKQAPAATYKDTRNEMLGADYSTKFSSALAHGLLSARTIAHRATQLDKSNGAKGRDGGGYWIIFELLWRDYFRLVSLKYGSSLYTIYGIEGELDEKTSDKKAREWIQPRSFDDKSDAFVRWATFETGVPLIDANMKELASTGFMSNRGRQNVASLLTKDLYYDWRLGAEWFEHLLVDYDPASNYGNWQYVAGVGNDPRASRQFNPIKQAKDYDQQAKYVKAWLPVLEGLPHTEAHHPWTRAEGSPEGYPSKPVVENNMWKSHYARDGSSRGGIRGGGGGGGRGGGRGRARGGRGRGRGRGSGDRSRNRDETHDQ